MSGASHAGRAMVVAILAAACQPEQAADDAPEVGNSTAASAAIGDDGRQKPATAINVEQDIRARANAEPGSKVVGGIPVPAGAMLSVVGITYGGSRAPRCTGTLIEADMVLTAAHCVCGDTTNPQARVSNVFVGNNWVTRTGPKAGLYYRVTAYRSGIASAQCRGLKLGRDLAVLKLSNPVRNVPPMRIAPDAVTSAARSFRVAGFGAIDQNATVYPDEKYEARVVAVSNSCQGNVSGAPDESFYGCQRGEEIVAGNRASPDSCRGDSGGPLLITAASTGGTASTDAFMLAGVTSRAVNRAPAFCGYGGIYERLTPGARQWIAGAVRTLRTVQ